MKRTSGMTSSGKQWLDAALAGQPAALWEPGLKMLRAHAELAQPGASIAAQEPNVTTAGIAVLRVFGGIFPRANFMTRLLGWTALDEFRATLRALVNEPQIGAIVIEFDSPGGLAEGLQETAAFMRGLRGGKPIVAMVNSLAASAAYYLAAQADEVVTSPDGVLGSIGTVILHGEESRALDAEGITVNVIRSPERKFEGNSYEPLSEAARARYQSMVDQTTAQFHKDVAAGRGVPISTVRSENWGRGAVLTAREAMSVGMASRIDTLDNVLAKLSRGPGRRGPRAEGVNLLEEELPADWPQQMVDRAAANVEAAQSQRRRRLRLLELGG